MKAVGEGIAVVIGIDGFLGRTLAAHLTSRAKLIVGVGRREEHTPSSAFVRARADVSNHGSVVAGLSLVFEKHRILPSEARIYHLAGLADASACEARPLEAFEANVLTTASLLEAARILGIPQFIFASSGLVYMPDGRALIDEERITRANSVYTATKLAAEAMIQGYTASFDMRAVILRLSNVYGAGMSPDTVLGTLLQQATAGSDTLRIRSGSPIRDFLHVSDACAGMVAAAESVSASRTALYNLASGVGSSIREVAGLIAGALKPAPTVIELEPETVGTSPWLVLSSERLRGTGWRPRLTLAEGLAQSAREQASGAGRRS